MGDPRDRVRARSNVEPSDGGAAAREREVAAAMRAIRREQGASRKQSALQSRARLLDWLDDWVFGCRMPSAESLIRDARWSRDSLADFCARCGGSRVPYESVRGGCGECRSRRLDVGAVRMAGTVRLGRYAPPLSRWVPSIKSRAWRDMGVVMGRELGLQVRDAVESGLVPQPDAVVSMPVHWTRVLLRGIDHAALLAEEVSRVLGVERHPLLRARLASRQTGGSREQRAGNRGRFVGVPASELRPGCTVLLIDDVRTTGSTLREGMAALGELGVGRVVCGTCAVADAPRRTGQRG